MTYQKALRQAKREKRERPYLNFIVYQEFHSKRAESESYFSDTDRPETHLALDNAVAAGFTDGYKVIVVI